MNDVSLLTPILDWEFCWLEEFVFDFSANGMVKFGAISFAISDISSSFRVFDLETKIEVSLLVENIVPILQRG